METAVEYKFVIDTIENFEREILETDYNKEFKDGITYALGCVKRNIESGFLQTLVKQPSNEYVYGEDF